MRGLPGVGGAVERVDRQSPGLRLKIDIFARIEEFVAAKRTGGLSQIPQREWRGLVSHRGRRSGKGGEVAFNQQCLVWFGNFEMVHDVGIEIVIMLDSNCR